MRSRGKHAKVLIITPLQSTRTQAAPIPTRRRGRGARRSRRRTVGTAVGTAALHPPTHAPPCLPCAARPPPLPCAPRPRRPAPHAHPPRGLLPAHATQSILCILRKKIWPRPKIVVLLHLESTQGAHNNNSTSTHV